MEQILRGVDIYVGSDQRGVPTRIFEHLSSLLGGGQTIFGLDGNYAHLPFGGPFDRFFQYKANFEALMESSREEFFRSEYFYAPYKRKGRREALEAERSVFEQVRGRVLEVRQDDRLWVAVWQGGPRILSLNSEVDLLRSELHVSVGAGNGAGTGQQSKGEANFGEVGIFQSKMLSRRGFLVVRPPQLWPMWSTRRRAERPRIAPQVSTCVRMVAGSR